MQKLRKEFRLCIIREIRFKEPMLSQKDILIMGIGNILLKDEGIGVHVVRRLKEMSLPEIDFLDALYISDVRKNKPEEVIVIGIEPKDMSDGVDLSPEIEERIPRIIEIVMEELKMAMTNHQITI